MSAIVFAATEKCSGVSEADILDQNTHVLLQLLNESVMIDQKRFGFVSRKKYIFRLGKYHIGSGNSKVK